MRVLDSLLFSSHALLFSRRRTLLIMLAMAVGVGAVVTLSALAHSARLFISQEFNSLGSNLLIVLPGKTETTGQLPPLVGHTTKDLTLADAEALEKLTAVKYVAPVIIGSAPLSHGRLEREVTVVGSTAELQQVRNLSLLAGRFLPEQSAERAAGVIVISSTLKQSLFGHLPALGQWVRLHDRRYRVIGILSPMGESLGIDIGELAVIPVADAQQLFDTRSLFRILLQARHRDSLQSLELLTRQILRKRHHGKEDFTLITQRALLGTFDKIFVTLGYAVTGIAAISLVVAGILIMNVMLVAVAQRRQEIGLLKALGGSRHQVQWQFTQEALLLSLTGALAGILTGYLAVKLFNLLYPQFPLGIPGWSVIAAILVATLTGLVFGTLPAARAARLDPVQALQQHPQ